MPTPKQRQARVTRTVRDFRAALIKREHAAIAALAQSYDTAYQSLIDELTAAIDNAQRAIDRNDPIVNTWRVHRAVELTRRAEQLLGEIAERNGIVIAEQQRGAARDAFAAAGKLLDAVMGEPPEHFPNASSFMRFPTAAIEQMTGTLAGGPLRELLDTATGGSAEQAGKILTGAIATGTHPSLIAEELQKTLDSTLYRASLIARTEINRAYREGLRATMAANRHIIPKWQWRSARLLTTCAACWALDGREFDVDTPMGTHPGCRCCLVPVPIGWDQLAKMHGIEMPPGDWSIPREPTGPEAFAALPESQQQRILDHGRLDGKTPRWDAWHAGQVELRDFVHTTHSEDWGITRRESGLRAALARSKKRNGGILPSRPVTPRSQAQQPPEQLADRHGDLVTLKIQSPEERKAELPKRNWEEPRQRKLIPADLQQALAAPNNVLRMGHHAWQFVQPPKPGAALAQNGIDAIKGQGKHFSARSFVDDLDQLFGEWYAMGIADSVKTPVNENRWQVITPGPPGGWLRVVIAEVKGSGEHYIYTAYPITDDRARILLEKGHVRRRGENSRP